jgi:hypothetical protein
LHYCSGYLTEIGVAERYRATGSLGPKGAGDQDLEGEAERLHLLHSPAIVRVLQPHNFTFLTLDAFLTEVLRGVLKTGRCVPSSTGRCTLTFPIMVVESLVVRDLDSGYGTGTVVEIQMLRVVNAFLVILLT